jgi:hypothetical protein
MQILRAREQGYNRIGDVIKKKKRQAKEKTEKKSKRKRGGRVAITMLKGTRNQETKQESFWRE